MERQRLTTIRTPHFPRAALMPLALTLVVPALVPLLAVQDDARFDFIIRGGQVVDGTGNRGCPPTSRYGAIASPSSGVFPVRRPSASSTPRVWW